MGDLLKQSPRLSPNIDQLRRQMPYVNYNASDITPSRHAHPHLSASSSPSQTNTPSQVTLKPRWKTLKSGYGSRHEHDVAEFSLWNDESQRFKFPNPAQMQWVKEYYKATEVRFEFPVIIVITNHIPDPLPLTVACVAARFVPSAPLDTMPRINSNYATPRLPDPVPFVVQKWASPAKGEIEMIVSALLQLCSPKAINWHGPYCFVELRADDDRVYQRHSLPGVVAGKTTTYHHAATDLWENTEHRALLRVVNPQASAAVGAPQDKTNYLQQGTGVLQPGVRIASAISDHQRTTTCGIRLRHQDGRVIVTVANHGIPDSAEVYHPSSAPSEGSKIGDIIERWPVQDVAMVSLNPAIRFTNNEYFEATPPRQLLRSDYAPEGAWCSCDGMSTGVVFLQCQGARISDIHPEVTNGVKYRTEKIYSAFGPLGGEATEGICGAPIVQEGDELYGGDGGGGICGMFRFGNSLFAIAPVLDDLIDAGWELY